MDIIKAFGDYEDRILILLTQCMQVLLNFWGIYTMNYSHLTNLTNLNGNKTAGFLVDSPNILSTSPKITLSQFSF